MARVHIAPSIGMQRMADMQSSRDLMRAISDTASPHLAGKKPPVMHRSLDLSDGLLLHLCQWTDGPKVRPRTFDLTPAQIGMYGNLALRHNGFATVHRLTNPYSLRYDFCQVIDQPSGLHGLGLVVVSDQFRGQTVLRAPNNDDPSALSPFNEPVIGVRILNRAGAETLKALIASAPTTPQGQSF